MAVDQNTKYLHRITPTFFISIVIIFHFAIALFEKITVQIQSKVKKEATMAPQLSTSSQTLVTRLKNTWLSNSEMIG